jgi:hypothetical protein
VSQVYSSHRRIDDRNLAMGKLIAEKLRADPSLVGVGIANIQRWNKMHGETTPADLEWLEILHGPLDTILDVLTSSAENATRLRSSHPFAGVVSLPERQVIFESYKARTYHQSR